MLHLPKADSIYTQGNVEECANVKIEISKLVN